MNLVSLLIERAQRHPERIALAEATRTVTYGELARRVAAGAGHLEALGLKRGQTILVFQPVSIELYEFLLAAFHGGLRVMLADPSAGRDFLSRCCQRLMPDAFFGSWKAQCLRMSVREMRGIGLAIRSGGWFPGAQPWRTDGAPADLVAVDDQEAALVTFTSGSTGVPKAALRSHGFLLAQHRALSRALDFEEGEVDLVTLPVFVLANLASGLTSVLAATDLAKPGTPDAAAISAQCGKFRVTRCAASPAFFEGLLAGGLPRFQKLYTGGAPVFPDLLRRLGDALPAASIYAVYGSTEAEPIAHFHGDEDAAILTRRGGGLCAGVPVAEIKLRIIADQSGTPLNSPGPVIEAGQVGEIIVSGEHVLSGYLGGIGDEETKIHEDGRVWHRTGDAGWIDARGRLWLLGRCAEKLPAYPAADGLPTEAMRYPFAVECALREIFPEIRMAALTWEERRTLVVGKMCAGEEQRAISASAEIFGMERVIYLKALPLDRRHNAKIDYPALRALMGEEGGQTSHPP